MNDSVAIPHNAAIDSIEDQDKVTIAAWVYPHAWYSGWFGVVDQYESSGDHGWGLGIYTTPTASTSWGRDRPLRSASTCRPWINGRTWRPATTEARGKVLYYVNGTQQCAVDFTGDIMDTAGEPLYIGYNPSGSDEWSNGRVDDLRMYPRALSAAEIQALYLGGWQPASLGQSGTSVSSTTWQMPMPQSLEGSYRIEARGWDSDGHTSPPRNPVQSWSGEADTLAPRVTLARTASGTGYRYTTTAEDYNLTGAGLVTPCPTGTITVTTNFQSPWYVAANPTTPRLYRLVQDCTLAASAASERRRPATRSATAPRQTPPSRRVQRSCLQKCRPRELKPRRRSRQRRTRRQKTPGKRRRPPRLTGRGALVDPCGRGWLSHPPS